MGTVFGGGFSTYRLKLALAVPAVQLRISSPPVQQGQFQVEVYIPQMKVRVEKGQF